MSKINTAPDAAFWRALEDAALSIGSWAKTVTLTFILWWDSLSADNQSREYVVSQWETRIGSILQRAGEAAVAEALKVNPGMTEADRDHVARSRRDEVGTTLGQIRSQLLGCVLSQNEYVKGIVEGWRKGLYVNPRNTYDVARGKREPGTSKTATALPKTVKEAAAVIAKAEPAERAAAAAEAVKDAPVQNKAAAILAIYASLTPAERATVRDAMDRLDKADASKTA